MKWFEIWGEKADGEILKLFTWVGDLQVGLKMARRDAKTFKMDLVQIWAEEIIGE